MLEGVGRRIFLLFLRKSGSQYELEDEYDWGTIERLARGERTSTGSGKAGRLTYLGPINGTNWASLPIFFGF
jgi:hypothetical protein